MTALQTETRAITLTQFPALPALIDATVTHHRYEKVRRGFKHRVYEWLVDLDGLPAFPRYLRPLASFRSADHLGDPSRSIKANVEAFLATRGVRLGSGGRIVMLAHARVLGHVFNPLTVFFCFPDDGTPPRVVAEVHNTYGDRHAYLVEPDAAGHADAEKAMYVSPFFAVEGDYQLRFTVAADRVFVSVTLRRAGKLLFSAVFSGQPHTASRLGLLKAVARRPFMTQRVSALIRAHGVRLWLRRLPVQRRPIHQRQTGV